MTEPAPVTLHAFGVTGVGELTAGDDLASELLDAMAGAGTGLQEGDLLVVSSKVVSKTEGLSAPGDDRDRLIGAQTVRLVARRRTPTGLAQIVQAKAGPVMAAAGVDASNVAPGQVLLLPADPDDAARRLRARLVALGAPRIGVLLSDTAGRAWRDGQTDFALGAAGVRITDDLRGGRDTHGQPLEVTVRALADEVAALADLVKGKLGGVPAAVVRGLPHLVLDDDGPGAAALLRPAREDWFRLGHVEAVRACLGLDPGAHEPPRVPRDPVTDRLQRAVEIALSAPDPLTGQGPVPSVRLEGDVVRIGGLTDHPEDLLGLGALAQRLVAAAWSEDLTLELTRTPDGLTARAGDPSPG